MSEGGQRMNAVIAEYNSLRQEILGYQRDSMTILGYCGVFVGLTFAYAAQSQVGVFFFVIFILLLAPLTLQVQRLRSTYRIGRYIQYCLETPETGLAYEGRWIQLKQDRRLSEPLLSFKVAVALPIMLLQVVSLILMVYFNVKRSTPTGDLSQPPSGSSTVIPWWLAAIFCVLGAAVLGYEAWLVWRADDVRVLDLCYADLQNREGASAPQTEPPEGQ